MIIFHENHNCVSAAEERHDYIIQDFNGSRFLRAEELEKFSSYFEKRFPRVRLQILHFHSF